MFATPKRSYIPDARLAADSESAQYKTNEIDAKIKNLPAALKNALATDAASGLVELVAYINEGADTDFLKIKRIHDWVTDNIAYDNEALDEGSEKGQDAYSVIAKKRATCGGFALTFKTISERAGFESSVIFGKSRKSFNTKTQQMMNHIWNSVKINSKWYIVDTTHDSRFSFSKGKFTTKSGYRDAYLFIAPAAKIFDNMPVEEQYQYLDKPVSEAEFLNKPFVTMHYIKYGIDFVTDITAIIQKEKLTPQSGVLQQRIIEKAYLKTDYITIELKKPENVTVYGKVKDSSNRFYDKHAYCSQAGNTALCKFSAPKNGEFTAYISARFMDPPEKVATQVYSFQIMGQAGPGEEIPNR